MDLNLTELAQGLISQSPALAVLGILTYMVCVRVIPAILARAEAERARLTADYREERALERAHAKEVLERVARRDHSP